MLLAASLSIRRKRLLLHVYRLSVCKSVCPCVRKVYCGKTADWMRMPFGVVSGVGRRMGVLPNREGKGSFGG